MQTTTDRDAVLKHLRSLLRDVFVASQRDVAQARLARAHGYADGYMKALLQTGVVTQRELLAVVAEEQAAVGVFPLRVATELTLEPVRRTA
jgi:hypothetical protein